MASSPKDLTPGVIQPWVRRLFCGAFGRWLRFWHRPQMYGVENLPSDRPFMIVANHSGGGIREVFVLAAAWIDLFDDAAPIAGFAHPAGFRFEPFNTLIRGLGCVPSSYEGARTAAAAGTSLLVFPGGDHEAARPFWQASVVDFGGRKGFLKVAADAGLPVVPLRIHGSHLATPILWRGGNLWATFFVTPRFLFGLKRYPVTLSGVAFAGGLAWLGFHTALGAWGFALAYLWLALPFHVGWPSLPLTYRFQFGRPIELSSLFGAGGVESLRVPHESAWRAGSPPSADALCRAYTRVVTALCSLRLP